MRDNVYKFRKIKWGEPKRLEMIAGLKPKQRRSHYSSGLIVLCAFIGLVAVRVWLKLSTEFSSTPTELVSAPASISLHVIDGDTVNLGDGRPNVRLVGFNDPKRESELGAKQSVREVKPLNSGSANLSPLVDRIFSRLRALVHQRRKARMRATSAVDAERFESMALMPGKL
jgi:hypothetical protein